MLAGLQTEPVPIAKLSSNTGSRRLPFVMDGSFAAFVQAFVAFAGSRIAPALGLIVIGACVEGIGLLLLLPLLSVVLEAPTGHQGLDWLTGNLLGLVPRAPPFWQVASILALFAIVIAIRGFIILQRDIFLARLQLGFVESRRVNIIRLLATARWDTVSRLRHGRIAHVLGEDVRACGEATFLLLQSVAGLAMLAVQFALVLLLSPMLAMLVLLLGVFFVVALRPMLSRVRAIGTKYTATQITLANGTIQFLGGLKLAMSQNLQHSYVRGFETSIAEAVQHQIGFTRRRTIASLTLTASVSLVAGIWILWGVGVMQTPIPVLATFLFILTRMSGIAARLQNASQHIAHSLPAYEKLTSLEKDLSENLPNELSVPVSRNRLPRGPIVFRDVSFRHQDNDFDAPGQHGLFDVNLRIEAGEFVGLTGSSGSGKTTFCDLLVGLYPPRSGLVIVGKAPLAGDLLPSWRQGISYISQDSFLFHDSIRENLLWARPDAQEGALWKALEAAGAETIVKGTRAGLDTIVGERGMLLSGGERQRIALARALLRKPTLIVLDEATNAIDTRSEAEILGGILASRPRPTIIMVAHREDSLRLCDRRIRLENGRVVTDEGSL